MEEKKWYIGTRSAEGRAVFFVQLAKEEETIIRRFLSQQDNGIDEGYSGTMGLVPIPFDTMDDAKQYYEDADTWDIFYAVSEEE